MIHCIGGNPEKNSVPIGKHYSLLVAFLCQVTKQTVEEQKPFVEI